MVWVMISIRGLDKRGWKIDSVTWKIITWRKFKKECFIQNNRSLFYLNVFSHPQNRWMKLKNQRMMAIKVMIKKILHKFRRGMVLIPLKTRVIILKIMWRLLMVVKIRVQHLLHLVSIIRDFILQFGHEISLLKRNSHLMLR